MKEYLKNQMAGMKHWEFYALFACLSIALVGLMAETESMLMLLITKGVAFLFGWFVLKIFERCQRKKIDLKVPFIQDWLTAK